MCGIWSCVFPVAFVLPVPAQVLVVALCSVAEVAAYSPNPRFLALVLGFSCLAWGFFALALELLGCACGVAF